MDKKRLWELRKRVFADYQEWDVKCSQDGFQEASPTGEMDADGKDLTTLIDAEIARQSVTDEAVQMAIEIIGCIKPSAFPFESAGKIGYEYDDVVSAINAAKTALRQYKKPVDGSTSDGYHTFDELYEHRTALFATLCNMRSDISWKSMKHNDGTMYDGMFIAGIKTPEGQYTYHCNMKYLYMFAYTPEVDKAPPYDGHQPKDYPRLLGLSENSLYRQSVTDEQIRTALDYVNDYKKEAMEYDTSVGIFPPTSEEVRAWETVETALRQYQKPTDEAVQNMVQTFESFLSSRHDADWTGDTVSNQYLHDAILTALRQMKPSEWIPVSKRLPTEELASVLVYTKDGGVSEGQYYPTIKSWKQFRWSVENATVTHWMPLPQPPESEG